MKTAEIGSRVIETACGLFLDPIDPDPAQFRLGDIGHALSHMCRYNGACSRFYSVAEHSMLVGDLLRQWGCGRQTILTGLMHDASEAYLPDLASPLKRDGWGTGFRDAENLLLERLAERFGFDWPMCKQVKEADEAVMWCETHVLMPSGGKTWGAYETRGKWFVENHSDVIEWVKGGKRRFEPQATAWWMEVTGEGAK
jgi:hypothetical protein